MKADLRCQRFCAIWLMAVVFGGCDQRPLRVPVAGTVLIDGQPLTKGFVRFIPDAGRAASGELNAQGHFELGTFEDRDGALIGRHRVEVIAVENPTAQKVRYLTPVKYRSSDTSGIEFDISKPETALEIKLSWSGEQPQEETMEFEGAPITTQIGEAVDQ
jgi:hypothetical protein